MTLETEVWSLVRLGLAKVSDNLLLKLFLKVEMESCSLEASDFIEENSCLSVEVMLEHFCIYIIFFLLLGRR